MKKANIKTDKEELKELILEKYGINLERYKNPEIVQKIGDMILFPNYAAKNILGSVILALIGFVIFFLTIDMSATLVILYVIFGGGLWFLFGLLGGINFFLHKIEKDMQVLITYGFELTKNALNDLESVGDKLKKEGIGEIFKGVVVVIIIPSVTEAISGQIPIIGAAVNNAVDRILLKTVDRILLRIGDNMKFHLKENSGTTLSKSDHAEMIHNLQTTLQTSLKGTFRVVKLPLKLLWVISFVFLLIFLGLMLV